MKKLLAIVLLTAHLFNIGGYNLVFQYLIADVDVQVNKYIDNNRYNEKDLVELKVPLNMPYLKLASDFERVNGQIELEGVQYNYVKRKILADTLYILCYPNFAKTEFSNAKADYAKQNADLPSGKKNNETSIKKSNVGSDYTVIKEVLNFNSILGLSDLKGNYICAKISSVVIKGPAQPPDINC